MRAIAKSTYNFARIFPKIFYKFPLQQSLLRSKNGAYGLQHRNQYYFSASSHENISKGTFQGPGFYVEQLLTGCLSIYSYYIESNGEAFLIDPLNEIHKYEEIIKGRNSTLKGVFQTHYHADYVAGHYDLKKKFNCQIYMGPTALDNFGVKVLKDNEKITLGDITFQLIHTPGHTEESSCLLMYDKNQTQTCIFTGDTMFLNEVGRPDLAVKSNLTVRDLASMLYNSLQKLKSLNNQIRIYPGHGAGSSCGKAIGKGDFCHLEKQKQTNYALKAQNKEEFIKQILQGMPVPPQYFSHDVTINKFKPFDYSQAQNQTIKKLSLEEVIQKFQEQAIIIDVRPQEELHKGMIKDTYAVDFKGAFAPWVGALFSPTNQFVIYSNDQNTAKESIRRMLRIGYTKVAGYFINPLSEINQKIAVYKPQFKDSVKEEGYTILDVRKPSEIANGIFEGDTVTHELGSLFKNINNLDRSKKYIVHCQSGFRAKIGYSLLKNYGYETLVCAKPFNAIKETGVKIIDK